jgi:hypothetical protein
MSFAKRPTNFSKGEKVLVDGSPAVVMHVFGGEDAGWVRVKMSDGSVREVNAELHIKKITKAQDSLGVVALIASLLAWYQAYKADEEAARNQASGYNLENYRPKPRGF